MKSPTWLGEILRILRGVVTMGLVWTPAWIALFFGLLGLIIVVIQPGPDSDVGTLRMTRIIGWVGFCSGGLFGLILSRAERGRVIAMVSLGRAVSGAFWHPPPIRSSPAGRTRFSGPALSGR